MAKNQASINYCVKTSEVFMAWMSVDGVRLFYTDDQPDVAAPGMLGVPTLLVHGWLTDGDDWVFQLPTLRERCRTVTPDLRGHGRSDAPSGGYSPTRMAADLAALLDHLAISKVLAIGHSSGAEVCVALEASRPDLVLGLVAVDPAYGLAAERRGEFVQLAGRLATSGGAEAASLFFEGTEGPRTPLFLREWHRRRPLGVPAHVLAGVYYDFAFGPDSTRMRPGSDAVLERRACPVLSFHRNPDAAVRDRQLSHHAAGRALVYPDTGHWLHQEEPERFAADLELWTTSLSLPLAE